MASTNNNNNNNNSISRTRRTADGRSAGGKIVRGRRTARTPYDPPIPATNRATQTQSPNWFTGIIYPTSRLIATSATSLLSSIFRPDTSSSSSSSSSSSATDCSEDGIDYENDDCRTPFVGIDGLNKKYGTTPESIECFTKEPQLTVGKSETKRVLEKLLMQETFSREECDRLIMIINSRVIDGSDIQEQHDGRLDIHDLCSKAVMEAKQWLEEKKVVPSCKSNLDHGTCTLNSVVQPQVAAGELGSPVDMAKSYMLARPPWASPSINYVESRTPLPMGRELLKEETPFSVSGNSFSASKKMYSLSSGSWNIQEEIRRLRSKATEDMIRTTPSTKFDLSSFALEPKSIKKSLLADETELSGADKMNDLNMLPATKSIDASLELAVRENTCHGLPASVLEVTQACSWNEDLLFQSIEFSSAQNQDLEASRTIEGEEHTVSKTRHETISKLALKLESRLSDRTCSSAREETEVRGNPNANGYNFLVSSLSTDVVQNPRPSGVSSSHDNLPNYVPREETCELLSEASIEVPVVNETNSVASGSLNSSTLHCEELTQKEIQLNPEHGSTGKATNVAEKKQGRKLSRYNRKSRGKG